MAHARSICSAYLAEINPLHGAELAQALLDFDDDVLFVDVFRAYMTNKANLPRELAPQFYRGLLQRPSNEWKVLLGTQILKEEALDEQFYKLAEKSLEDLVDPITLELPVVPVGTVHGRIYDDGGLRGWLREHDTDPCTREFLREYDVRPLELVADYILKKEPATAEEGEKKTKWCEKRADYLFRLGKWESAILDFKHVPSMNMIVERFYTMLDYKDDPDLEYSGRCEEILLLAAAASVDKAYLCLGMLEMQKARPDFDLGISYFESADPVDSVKVNVLLFEAMHRCKEYVRAAQTAAALVESQFKPDYATKEAFQFMADCALYGNHGVPLDYELARNLLRSLRAEGHLDDMQVKYAHMLLTGLGGDLDVVEGMMLLRNCMACAGEAQDLFEQIAKSLSGITCVRERHAEYVEARFAKRVRRLPRPEVIEVE